MEPSSSSSSFFQGIRTRELNGFKVRKRPHFDELSSDPSCSGAGVVSIEHNGTVNPPLAVSFGKTVKNSHFLAVSDEEGYVSLYDTRRKLPSYTSCREKAVEARVCEWVAHYNSIFDLCWNKDDSQILTASGDQSIKVWDTERRECVGILTGHTGSVKSICPHPSNTDLLVSGSRDGSFALWDLRCNPSCDSRIPTAMVTGAHVSSTRKRIRRGNVTSTSITSVLYLKDEISIASAGAVDSVVKFWDTRNMKSPVNQTCPHPEPSTGKESRTHGISCISQDSSGVFLTASCMNNRIYLYNVLQLDKGPLNTFHGTRFESFYVKSAISPDAAHILSGSSDGNAYIWQVKRPEAGPMTLKGHEGDVTAVNWCPSEIGKVATASDDFTVRIWNIQKGCFPSTRSPSSNRRRVMAIPNMECKKLFTEEVPADPMKAVSISCPSEQAMIADHSPNKSITLPEIRTPESVKKMLTSSFSKEVLEMKTPDASLNSPSSVLNPPSSLKRKTIRDYFAAVS
ncbi:Denticleless protein-like protein [Thalictrum thalictroides]|uniref:Denticleless protein-like protein n=1 Tax=Thalictrum thalictroides TaxID=46969 RepID=A0A7J6WNA5_THATH|nr:Denticleless protein-like protein [Thalictrum thalictroides]